MKKKNILAALTASGLSLENLRTDVCQKAVDVATFKSPNGNCPGGPWVRDILAPDEDGDIWCAVISAPDGKTYEQDFTVEEKAVKFSGDPREVIQQTTYTPAEASRAELKAGDVDGHDFHGNQWTAGVAAAHAQSEKAEKASRSAEKKGSSEANYEAVKEHARASEMHTALAHQAKAAGDKISQRTHEALAADHERARAQHFGKAKELLSSSPENGSKLAFEGSVNPFAMEAPTTFDKFMVMAGGVQTVTLGCAGQPLTVTINVTPDSAKSLQAQLEAVNSGGKQRAFNCFDHEKKAASSWPKKFFWSDAPAPGVYEAAEPSKAGLEAVEGKTYRGFSMTFFSDAAVTPRPAFKGGGYEITSGARGSAENPASIICPLEAGDEPSGFLNMGTMTNRPAFTENEPLFAANPQINSPPIAAARTAGAPTNTSKTTDMNKQLDAAALQERCGQLEARCAELQAKTDAVSQAQLTAAQAELENIQTKLELAKEREKIVLLEAGNKKRREIEADSAVETMVNNGVIPSLDKEMRAQYREKFIADPSLIPMLTAQRGAIANGRQTHNGTAGALAPRLEFGAVKEGAIRILSMMAKCCMQQKPIQGLDASSCEKRSIIAREIAMIYRNEIRSKTMEMDAQGQLRPAINPDFIMAPLEAAADTDTLGTLAGTLVSQRYLDIFMYKLPMIANGKIMTDFSDQPSELNQTVNTRKIVVPGVMTYDPTLDTDGYPKGWIPATAAQTTDVNITMDELIGVPIQFDLAALSSTQRNLFGEQAPAAAYANALYFLKKIYNLCTAANFNSYAVVTAADANGIVKVPTAYVTYPVAQIDFSRSRIAEIAAAFDANEVPDEDRSLLLNAGYYNKGTTDPSIVTFFAGQQSPEIITQGRLPELGGFTPIKAPNFPGTNNRFGMALQKNGLIAKSRLPANLNTIQNGAGNGTVTQIVHPETGVAMLVVLWTDHKRGYSAWLPCAILGAAVGDKRGGLVMTTQ